MSARKVPASQNWSQKVEPLSAVKLPGGQRRHDAREPTGVYEPGAHGMGAVERSGHALPAGHSAVDDVVAQKEPAAHGTHVAFEVAPDEGEKVPLAHGVGAVDDTGQ